MKSLLSKNHSLWFLNLKLLTLQVTHQQLREESSMIANQVLFMMTGIMAIWLCQESTQFIRNLESRKSYTKNLMSPTTPIRMEI